MSETKIILIVANSGRMLAQMIKNAGYSVVVIDCFLDVDTQALSLECIKVDSLGLANIKKAFCLLNAKYILAYAIYGSGFEFYLASLAYLQQNIKVLGNSVDVFAAVQNITGFFSKLDKLDMPYPGLSFQPPKRIDGWLVKPLQGEGGSGIKRYKGFPEKHSACYWQRFINGVPMSVLFVSDGSSVDICGFHKQQVVNTYDSEFVFSAIISQPEIDDKVKSQLSAWVSSLVIEFGLKGLNSVDFMLEKNQCFVLEVNPRPSASMQLYDDSLVEQHIKSCLNESFSVSLNLNEYKAYQVIYAETDIKIKKDIQWPLWLVDIPQEGSLIHTGWPICSIIARGKSEQQVADKLLIRQKSVKKLLK